MTFELFERNGNMQRIEIAKIYSSPNDFADKKITVCGWVRTIRDSKALGFIDLNDGSYFKGIQIVFEEQAINNFTEIAKQNVGTALVVTGTLVLTPEAKQPFEIKAEEIFDIEFIKNTVSIEEEINEKVQKLDQNKKEMLCKIINALGY